MYCPTCASPLPVGAMFCGECGRAVSSADVAAAQRRADEAAEHVDAAAPPESPRSAPRDLHHARQPSGADRPWWVRDRDAAEVPPADEPPAPPSWPVPSEALPSPAPSDEVAPEARVAPRDDTSVPESVTPSTPATASAEAAPGSGAPESTTAPEPPAEAPRAQASVPAPLKNPGRHPENGPRPTSAPLWTASLTPISGDDAPEPTTEAPRDGDTAPVASLSPEFRPATRSDGSGAERDDDAVAASADRADTATGDPDEPDEAVPSTTEAAESGDSRVGTIVDAGQPRGPVVSGDDDETAASAAPDVEAAAATAAAPELEADSTPDRTHHVEPARAPLVEPAPVPLVEPGSSTAVERCTHCGAAIGEDDIFCGECGAVVQSVALSFTGPIAPLPPEWRPDTRASAEVGRSPQNAPVAADGSAGTSSAGEDSAHDGDDVAADGNVAADGAHAAGRHGRTEQRRPAEPLQESARAVPPVVPPIDHVPGFRAERPPVMPRSVVGDVPPAPVSSSAPAWRPRRPVEPVPSPADDDVDETRIVRRGPLGTEFVLQFSTGESIIVDGTGLVGRAPSPQPGERFDQLVRIVDPGKSVSKTHLEFGQDAGTLWISDRWSGNGTVVRPRDATPRRADPGTRVRVERGAKVEIGEQFFIVV